ncbi:major capsid protein [Thiomicrorhabdus chilensis]|uniref:major capsid protein n=1 Tax=Thiomicrorhabdus chilensis TaxID=63656 RepID=UPI0004216926|nr:major capsid protein [Thiomicrorhabdus chilensis]
MDEATAQSAELAAAVNSGVGMITGDGMTAIASVGAAMIGLAVLAVVIKWVKASFFG